MPKALLIRSNTGLVASGDEFPPFGSASGANEADRQVSCTEDATFSDLQGRITSGGSGNNTLKFRKNGVDGNETVTIAGTGIVEDAVNTDVLAAGDLFNFAASDTGTSPLWRWVRCNVEFANGHGNLHGIHSGGTSNTADNTTVFLALGGTVNLVSSEADAQWKCRGYDKWTAYQIRVTANARTTACTVRNRINGVDGGANITIGAGATGLFTAVGLNDAIADGDLINASFTTGAGAGESITITLAIATLKDSANRSETFGQSGGALRNASATADYYTIGGRIISSAAEADIRAKLGFAGVIKNFRVSLNSNTYTTDATFKLFQNGSAVSTITLTAGVTGLFENNALSIPAADSDEWSFEIVGGSTGSIVVTGMGMTIGPSPFVSEIVLPPVVRQVRNRQDVRQNLLALLVASAGTPFVPFDMKASPYRTRPAARATSFFSQVPALTFLIGQNPLAPGHYSNPYNIRTSRSMRDILMANTIPLYNPVIPPVTGTSEYIRRRRRRRS